MGQSGYYYEAGHNVAAAVILPLIGITAVGLRFYVRRKQAQKLKADDWLLVPAVLLEVGIAVVVLIGVATKTIGSTLQIPEGYTGSPFLLQTDQLELNGKLEWAFNLMYPLALGFTKASLLFFYLRVFSVRKWGKTAIFLKCLIALVAAWSVGFFFATLFACGTSISAIWGPTINLYTICTKTLARQLALSFTDVFADVVIIVIPIPLIWRLNLRKWRKIGISAIFLLGTVTIAASLTRLILFAQSLFLGFNPTTDEIELITLSIYWATIETGVGILAACLPSLASLFKGLTWETLAENVTTTARSLLRTTRRGSEDSRAYRSDQNSIALGRMYDSESGMTKSGSIRAHSSRRKRDHVAHSPAPSRNGDPNPPLPQVRPMKSYETSASRSKQPSPPAIPE